MPAPPSSKQKETNQKAMDAAKSKSSGNNYGGINTGSVKTNSKGSVNSFGPSTSNGSGLFGGINTNKVTTNSRGSINSFGPSTSNQGRGLLGGGISTPSASGSPLNNPVRTTGMNEAMRRFFDEPEDLTKAAYDRANPPLTTNQVAPLRQAAGTPTAGYDPTRNQVAPISPDALASRIAAISRGPGNVAGVMPGASPLSQQRTIQNLSGAMTEGGTPISARDLQRLSQTIAGESAGQPAMGQTAVGNTMLNRMALAAAGKAKYMGGGNIDALMGQYDATGMRPGTVENRAYQNAQLGTDTLGAGIASIAGAVSPNSKFNTEMPANIKEATSFYNPETSNPKWGGPQFAKLGDHVFGLPDELAGRGSMVTAARGMPPASSTQMASISPMNAPPTPQTQTDTGPSMWESYAPASLQKAVTAIDQNLVQPTKDQIEKYGGFERAGKLAQVAVGIMNFMPGGSGANVSGNGGNDNGAMGWGSRGTEKANQKPKPKVNQPVNPVPLPGPQQNPWFYPEYSQKWAGLPTGIGGYYSAPPPSLPVNQVPVNKPRLPPERMWG